MSTKAARQAMAAATSTAVTAAGLPVAVAVLPYDPPTITGATVTFATAGTVGTEMRVYARVYVPDVQSSEGQDLVDDLMDLVDAAADPAPRSTWTAVYDQIKGVFLMQTVKDFPREDF